MENSAEGSHGIREHIQITKQNHIRLLCNER